MEAVRSGANSDQGESLQSRAVGVRSPTLRNTSALRVFLRRRARVPETSAKYGLHRARACCLFVSNCRSSFQTARDKGDLQR